MLASSLLFSQKQDKIYFICSLRGGLICFGLLMLKKKTDFHFVATAVAAALGASSTYENVEKVHVNVMDLVSP